MKKLSKDEMKMVMGGLEDVIPEIGDEPGCKGNTCKTAGSCWPCSDGTHHCG